MPTIKFVTDSVADVPDDLVKKWDITVVPCFVNYGGQSYADDGIELMRESYYNEMATMEEIPTTSAMSPEFARGYIEKAFDGADHLIIIATPIKLSGIYNALRLGASELPPERVTMIDSGQLSLGIAWQVIIGAETAAETGDVAATTQAIHTVQEQQRVYAAIDSLPFLRRSGRVGWAASSLGSLLQIKPVVQVQDGEVSPLVRVRTTSRMIEKLAELARQDGALERLGILHVNNPKGAERLKELTADVAPTETEVITGTMSPALGTHLGPGALGFAALRKGWKDAITTGNTG